MMTRSTLLLATLVMLHATPAHADWWLKGFGGFSFARDSGIIDLDATNSEHQLIFGAAAGRDLRFVQIETEIALSPRFFRGRPDLLDTGSLTTLTANVGWTLPGSSAKVKGYLIGGGGLARIVIADKLDAFSRTSNKFVANAGAGLVIPTTSSVDAFAEFRYFRTTESEPTTISFGSEYLSYARLVFGARLRF